MPKRTGRPFQRRKRTVIRRDGGICHLCGQPGADSADHIEPWSVSHDDSLTNLAAVHHDVAPYCNRLRGDKPLDDFLNERAEVAKGWTW
jgi:5-methylcytosine-specific restriction protein A